MVEITKDNWKQAIKIDVHESQKKFVASNIHSIAESRFYEGSLLKGFINDSEMVGFSLCYLPPEEDDIGHIVRFMVDEHHQKKGYGRQSMKLLLNMFKTEYSKKKVTLTVVPENVDTREFYEKIGFVNTDEIVEGELKYSYKLE